MKKETLKSLGIGIIGSIIGMFAVRKIDDVIDDFEEFVDEQRAAMGGAKWSAEDKKKYDELLKKSAENISRDLYGGEEEEIEEDDEGDEHLHEMFGQPMENDGTPQGQMSFDDIRRRGFGSGSTYPSPKTEPPTLQFGLAHEPGELSEILNECRELMDQHRVILTEMDGDMKEISKGIDFLKERAKKKDAKKETKKKNKAQVQKTLSEGIMKDAEKAAPKTTGVEKPADEPK